MRSRAGCDIYMCEQTCSSKGATILASGLNSIQAKVKRRLSLTLILRWHTHAPNFLSQGTAKIRKLHFLLTPLCLAVIFFFWFSRLILQLGINFQKSLPQVEFCVKTEVNCTKKDGCSNKSILFTQLTTRMNLWTLL